MSIANPTLIELTRGGRVESAHVGALAIARANGELVVSVGDVSRPIFPRSAVKVFQALPLIESGAADRYGFGNRELALACASHSGTPEHMDLAASMLARAGRDLSALGCGAHVPMSDDSAFEMRRAGIKPTALTNNCSGKHAGMVATCVHCGHAVENYLSLDHPLQIGIARALEDFTNASMRADNAGIDGCSAPNWAIPLANLARAFATLITCDGVPHDRAEHCRRLVAACMSEPNLVAGPGRLDTRVMTALPGRIYMKTGAEAVYVGAFPASGLAFALKIDDGTKRASEAVAEAILQRVFGAAGKFGGLGPITNWMRTQTGELREGEALARALDKLPV
jgi:L-asparaginase II